VQAGRTEFYEKYHESIKRLLDRHFDVWSLDWRGQGLSSRLPSHYQAGYIDSYKTYLNDFHFFVQTKLLVQARGPLILLAHSMGGHLGLRYLREHQGLFKVCVLSAPMVDIQTAPFPRPILWGLALVGSLLGKGPDYAPAQHDFDERDRDFSTNRLTTDPVRFQEAVDWIDENPKLALGGVTFGWVRETLFSIFQLRQRRYAAKIETPVLILSSEDEEVVDSTSHADIARFMPYCQVISIPDCKHEILQENDVVQGIFWKAFDDFMEKWLAA
jgi:lysophospholipase